LRFYLFRYSPALISINAARVLPREGLAPSIFLPPTPEMGCWEGQLVHKAVNPDVLGMLIKGIK
jgi:hypothetical protein